MRPSVEGERRVQLIAAAARVIARSGYDAATLRDVAREAGISTGVIAYYFDGKDDLFAHVLRAASRAFRARLASARDAAGRRASSCSRWPRRRRPPTRTRARARAVDRLLGARGARPGARRLTLRLYDGWRGEIAEIVREGQRAGRVPQPTPIPRRSRAATPPRPTASRRTWCCTAASSPPTTCARPARRSSTRSRAEGRPTAAAAARSDPWAASPACRRRRDSAD